MSYSLISAQAVQCETTGMLAIIATRTMGKYSTSHIDVDLKPVRLGVGFAGGVTNSDVNLVADRRNVAPLTS